MAIIFEITHTSLPKGGSSLQFELPYGNRHVQFRLPDARMVETIHYQFRQAVSDPLPQIRKALLEPIGSPPLAEIAKGRSSAAIVISDSSRLNPSHLFLEEMIHHLNQSGMKDSQITVIVALGMHRKQTAEELIRLAGPAVHRRVRVINHSPHPDDCVYLGTTSRGTPIEINRLVAEADLRIATGNIEPHWLAGISGGVKALVPGVASQRCIERNHALSLTSQVSPGDTGNPLHRDMEEALAKVPVHFLLNTVVDHQKNLLGIFAGSLQQAHAQGAAFANEVFKVSVTREYDVVIASPGGWPKDAQLYQAVKTLQNASAAAKPGGTIVLAARCEEQFGNGVFQHWVETVQDRQRIVRELNRNFVLGAHKIKTIDEILQKQKVYLFSDMPAPLVELSGFHAISNLQETIDRLADNPSTSFAVMPFGALTFPVHAKRDS
ncbi:nickel-dependent lactate racemase [Paenibacillaceae bacterium T2]|uniref:Nickel-dependent lactate racemase n=2 Tax=Ferviditalea candida TaxID=3108399 RepID=A0ABU5ZNP4_9BACL|nr:nickel-dependent lactate racemase [Paenibacillaceae bacterium T2]